MNLFFFATVLVVGSLCEVAAFQPVKTIYRSVKTMPSTSSSSSRLQATKTQSIPSILSIAVGLALGSGISPNQILPVAADSSAVTVKKETLYTKRCNALQAFTDIQRGF
jgi:hypothetical protein